MKPEILPTNEFERQLVTTFRALSLNSKAIALQALKRFRNSDGSDASVENIIEWARAQIARTEVAS